MKRIFLLFGALGSGKTTFVREYLNNDIVTSPTYTFCNRYEINHKSIAHFDLYNSAIDYQILLEAIAECDLIFIEWADLLDKSYINAFESEIIRIYL